MLADASATCNPSMNHYWLKCYIGLSTLKKLHQHNRRWFELRARRESRRGFRHDASPRRKGSVRRLRKVQLWQGGDPEWAVCAQVPGKPPRRLCLVTNTRESIEFIERLQNPARFGKVPSRKIVDRSVGKMPRIGSYYDFSYPNFISTSAAVVLASHYEIIRARYHEVPPTVDLHLWNDDVFRKLYQLGFFEIIGISPQREDVVISEGDTRTMQIVSTKNADDLGRIDASLQNLCQFLNLNGGVPDSAIIDLLTGLSEAISNVTNHAYPPDYHPNLPDTGRLWVAATADRTNNSLTVVVYDRGVTIPLTYPRIKRMQHVLDFLSRTLRQQSDFRYQNDGTYIEAAMLYGGSRTDEKHRGKGLPQMMGVIERIGPGRTVVFSRGGWCMRDSNGRFERGAVPYTIGGTLIEWTVELPNTSAVGHS